MMNTVIHTNTVSSRARTTINLAVLLITIISVILVSEITLRVLAAHKNKRIFNVAMKGQRGQLQSAERADLRDIIQISSNPKIIYELRPNIPQVQAFYSLFETDEYGFRSRYYPVQKSPCTARILGIGDSVMFGMGVDNGREYLSVLERMLNNDSGITWEVINTAVPGYNTVMEVETLSEKGLKFKPDIVILGFVGNDYDLPNFIQKENDPVSLKRSYLVEFLSSRIDGILNGSPLETGLRPVELGIRDYAMFSRDIPEEYRDFVGLSAVKREMKRLKRLSEEYGFKVMVVFFDSTEKELDAPVAALSNESGFHIVDIHDAMLAANFRGTDLSRYFLVDDGHPNGLGHELAARAIYDQLSGNHILEEVNSKIVMEAGGRCVEVKR